MARYAPLVSPTAVISVGDNFYPAGIAPALGAADPQLAQTFTDAYRDPRLAGIPWWAVAGNHDLRGDLGTQLAWKGDARWHFPSRNYTKRWDFPAEGAEAGAAGGERTGNGTNSGQGSLRGGRGAAASAASPPPSPSRLCLGAVFVDTSVHIAEYRMDAYNAARYPPLMGNLGSLEARAQAAWADEALGDAGAACVATLLVGHHPPHSPGEHGDSPDVQAAYGPALSRRGVDAMLSGHDHLLAHLRNPQWGAELVLTGGGSEIRTDNAPTPETLWWASSHGFSIHAFNATHAAHAYVDAGAPDEHGQAGRVAFVRVVPLRPKPGHAAA